MEIISIVLGSTFSIVLVAIAKAVIKKLFKKDTPTLGALALLFVMALFVSAGQYYWQFLSPETQIAMAQIWGLAIIMYDFFVKAIWGDGVTLVKKIFGK